jgi:hypothetical protein
MTKTFSTLKAIRSAAAKINTELSNALASAESMADAQNLDSSAREAFISQEMYRPFLTPEYKDILEKLPISCKELIDELTSIQSMAFQLAKGTFNVPSGTSYTVNDGTETSLVISNVDITSEDNINLDVAVELCEKHFNIEVQEASDVFGVLDDNLKGVCRNTTIRSKRNLLRLYREGLMDQGNPYDWLMPCVTPAKKLGSQLQFDFVEVEDLSDGEDNMNLLSLDIQKKRTKYSCEYPVSSSEDILDKFAAVVSHLEEASPEEVLTAVALVNSIGALLLKENGLTEELINKSLEDLSAKYPGGLTINTGVGTQTLKIVKPGKDIDGVGLTNEELVSKYPDLITDKVIGVTTQYRFASNAADLNSAALDEAVKNGDISITELPASVSTTFKANKQ